MLVECVLPSVTDRKHLESSFLRAHVLTELSGMTTELSGGCDGLCDGFQPRRMDSATDLVADFFSCVFPKEEDGFCDGFCNLVSVAKDGKVHEISG